MTDLNDLIKNVYDYFQQKYGLDTGNLGPGSLFFAFEKLPTTVSATDFKLNPQDAEFNAAVALQHGSDLVNFAAALDPEGFIDLRGDLSPTVDGQYNLLLNAANPLSPPEGAGAQFLQVKGQALQKFEASKANMNMTDFWPASFTPQFWFNDQDPSIWTGYSYSTGQSTSTGTPSTPPFVVLTDWRWRVLASSEASTRWDVVTRANRVPASALVRADFQTANRAVLTPGISATLVAPAVSLRYQAEPVTMLARINDNVVDDQTTIDPGTLQVNRAELQLAQVNTLRLKQEAYKEVVITLPEENVSSSNFNLSFDYCLVNVSRSWISSPFLTAANWYASGSQSGAFAGGTYDGTPRPFAFLPAKFLVIKNLRISAQWSEEDRTVLQKSASLGPFSLVNRSFERETLTCPGMQIIAWFCQIMPVLPPGSDPMLPQ